MLSVNFGLKLAVLKFLQIFGLICFQILLVNKLTQFHSLLGKNLSCVKWFVDC